MKKRVTNEKANLHTTKKFLNKKVVVFCFIIVVAIYIIFTIYKLIKEPTNIFVVENGKLYLEEDAVRLYNS